MRYRFLASMEKPLIFGADGKDDRWRREMQRGLERLAAGSTAEDASRAVLREDYPGLMLSTAQFLHKAYL
jgi:hypothetical protein